MKKCHYCGSEYPDATVRCGIDNELLPNGELPPLLVLPETPTPTAPIAPPQVKPLTDRQMRIIEVALVCLVAFGSSIFISAYYLFIRPYGGSGANGLYSSIFNLMYASLHQLVSLGLLWYVLARRGKSFSDLGFGWVRTDLVWSLVLYLAQFSVFALLYYVLHVLGLAVNLT